MSGNTPDLQAPNVCRDFEADSKKIVEHLGLAGCFAQVHGSGLDGSYSNKEALIRLVLDRESFEPEDVVMVGDRDYDIVGAKSHGTRVIGVLWGYGPAEELTEAGADVLCEKPSLLYACIA